MSARHPELRDLVRRPPRTRLWSGQVRYLGVGAMLVGGVATLWRLRDRSGGRCAKASAMARTTQAAAVAREDQDLSTTAVLGAVALTLPLIFAICLILSGSVLLSAALAIALAFIGFFATAIAGYLTGIVGASNNPVSGVTIIVLLAIALLLKLWGVPAAIGPHLAITAGAVVCTAAAMAGDSLHDLATGYHVRRDAACARNLGAAGRARLVARDGADPQSAHTRLRNCRHRGRARGCARRAAGVPDGQSGGGRFRGRTAVGCDRRRASLLAAALVAVDAILERRGARWRTPVMPVAIGLYLPFGLERNDLRGIARAAGAQPRRPREQQRPRPAVRRGTGGRRGADGRAERRADNRGRQTALDVRRSA